MLIKNDVELLNEGFLCSKYNINYLIKEGAMKAKNKIINWRLVCKGTNK